MSEQSVTPVTTDDITVTDPRVQEIAATFGIAPDEVLTDAREAAQADGLPVGTELDAGEDLVKLMGEMAE